MPNSESTTLTHLMSQLETLWSDLDTLFGAPTADEWSRPYGPGRIFADVSAHLADFDRDVVVAGLERGVQAPRRQPQRPETPVELNEQIEWTFTGPGGGQWTMNIAEGQAVVREGQAQNPDLAFTQSPETFVKTLHRLHDPMTAMLTGEIKVRGFERMGDFDRLFPDSRFGPPVEHPP